MKQSPQNVPRNCPASGPSNCDPVPIPRAGPCSLEVRGGLVTRECTARATGKLTNVKMAKLAPYSKTIWGRWGQE